MLVLSILDSQSKKHIHDSESLRMYYEYTNKNPASQAPWRKDYKTGFFAFFSEFRGAPPHSLTFAYTNLLG